MTYSKTLFNPVQAEQAWREVWPSVKAFLITGQKLELRIKRSKKSREQEEKYHALIGDIFKAMASVGSEWDREDWKRLLIDQWAQDNGQEGSRVAPSLDGRRIVQLGLQSRQFTVTQGSSFIEWLYAWGADKGVTFSE